MAVRVEIHIDEFAQFPKDSYVEVEGLIPERIVIGCVTAIRAKQIARKLRKALGVDGE